MSNNYILTSNGALYSEDELYHHGVKGMKWGVRRYENEDGTLTAAGKKRRDRQIEKISKMYDKYNMRASKKAAAFQRRGKHAKAGIMKELVRENTANKNRLVNKIKNSSAKELSALRAQDVKNNLFGGQRWMKNHAYNMTTSMSRLNESSLQRGTLWTINLMSERTLRQMSAKDGLQYLRNEVRDQRARNAGIAAGYALAQRS
jgi:hypothetical protein